MSETVKMTDVELVEVRALQEKFQQKMFQLGQNTLQKLQAAATLKFATEQETKLGDEWVALQKEENQLIDKLLAKYGEGSLDLNAGTFVSEKKPTPS